jgi:hypothetical protein
MSPGGFGMKRLLVSVLTASVTLVGVLVAEPPAKRLTFVDLQAKANVKLADNLGSELPKGEQTFEGVQFRVGAAMLLLGSKPLKTERPEAIEGVQVGKAAAKLHLLHGTLYGNGSVIGQEGAADDPLYVPDGTRIAEYKVHYEGGATETIPVVYGEDVRDWWFTPASKGVKRGKVAWQGDNPLAKGLGSQIRVFLLTWENPKPDKKITRIDFVKGKETAAAPFWIAASLEQ